MLSGAGSRISGAATGLCSLEQEPAQGSPELQSTPLRSTAQMAAVPVGPNKCPNLNGLLETLLGLFHLEAPFLRLLAPPLHLLARLLASPLFRSQCHAQGVPGLIRRLQLGSQRIFRKGSRHRLRSAFCDSCLGKFHDYFENLYDGYKKIKIICRFENCELAQGANVGYKGYRYIKLLYRKKVYI